MKSLKTTSVLLIFVIISIVSIIFIFYSIFSKNIESSSGKHLVTMSSLGKTSVENFFKDIEHLMFTIDQSDATKEIFYSHYNVQYKNNYTDLLGNYDLLDINENRIEDIYFLNRDGDIFLSTENKELESHGLFKGVLSSIFEERSVGQENIFLPIKTYKSDIYNQIYFSDIFENEGKAYAISILVVYDEYGTITGSVVANISLVTLDKLFSSKENLKDSEELYMIGSDLVMRTNSRLSKEPTRFSQIVKTENAQMCFGEQGNVDGFFNNYRNSLALEAHEYISQLDLCIIAEVDKREIMHVRSILIKIFIILGLVSIGTLLLFFEKILINTNFLKKKQLDLTKALFEKEKFKKALDTSEDNVFILDMEGRVIYMNESVASYTGFSSNDSIGKKINTLWWSDLSRETLDEIFKKIFTENKPGAWEIHSNKKNGDTYNSEIFITPVLKEGKLAFVMVIEHDIEKRKKLESLKDEFVSIASHELRTPMTVIRGYASILLDEILGPLTEKQSETLRKIDGSSEKLISLVTDMLDLSKLNKGENQSMDHIGLDLKELLDEVSDEFNALVLKKNIGYTTNYNTDTKIVSNPTLLKRIFVNIIGNAVKFTDDNGHISVNVVPSEKDDLIRVEIVDDGHGIPEKYRSIVFEKFSQVEDYMNKSKGNEGTGLGLPISKKIVETLGGFIDFKNNKDKGVTFFFEVPRK